jgi:hypothetical protein
MSTLKPRLVRYLGSLALLVLLAGIISACDEDDPEIILTVSPTRAATGSATPTPAATNTARPSSTATATATPRATNTPAATSAPAAPAGYTTSCAAGYPWGQTLSGPFVCIESPAGVSTLGSTVALSGYAGGSFENSVVIEIRDENDVPIAQQPLTYTAPEIGTPGSWQVTLPMPPGQPSGAAGRIVAFFGSPRDGGILALDSIEVRFP